MKTAIRLSVLVCYLLVVVMSCKKKEDSPTPCKSKDTSAGYQLVLKLNLKGDNKPLSIGKGYFANAYGDSIQVRSFAFFISNLVLEDTTKNTRWVEKDSYHLAQFSADSSYVNLVIKNLPDSGQFNKLSFAIGVDQQANSSSAYLGKGDLILGTGMDWDWLDGWKFFLMEGNYKRRSDTTNGTFVYHIGFNTNYRPMSLPLIAPLGTITPQKGLRQTLVFDVEAKEVFGGNTIVNVKQNNVEMSNTQFSHNMADNYSTKAFLKPVAILVNNF